MVASVRLLFVLLAFVVAVGSGPEPANTQAPVQALEQNYLSVPPVVATVATATPELMRVERIMEVSAYVCEDAACRTAQGIRAEVGIVAATSLPMGQRIEIEGMGRYIVGDRGPLRADQLDVFFESREEAKRFGRQKRLIWLLRE